MKNLLLFSMLLVSTSMMAQSENCLNIQPNLGTYRIKHNFPCTLVVVIDRLWDCEGIPSSSQGTSIEVPPGSGYMDIPYYSFGPTQECPCTILNYVTIYFKNFPGVSYSFTWDESFDTFYSAGVTAYPGGMNFPNGCSGSAIQLNFNQVGTSDTYLD